MADYLTNKETEALLRDIEKNKNDLCNFKDGFARQMLNGLGEEMKAELSNPKKEGLFKKLARKLRRVLC